MTKSSPVLSRRRAQTAMRYLAQYRDFVGSNWNGRHRMPSKVARELSDVDAVIAWLKARVERSLGRTYEIGSADITEGEDAS